MEGVDDGDVDEDNLEHLSETLVPGRGKMSGRSGREEREGGEVNGEMKMRGGGGWKERWAGR